MKIRATRHLYPEAGNAATALSDEEQARIAGQRDRLKRKLKMARVLAAEDLLDEARDAVRDSILSAARVLAGQARLPEPEKLQEVLLPPLSARWEEIRPLIEHFVGNPNAAPEPLLHALQSLA